LTPLSRTDIIYGIDVTFGFLGWHYALDITINEKALDEKYCKLQKLRLLLQDLELERIGVCLIKSKVIDPQQFLSNLPRVSARKKMT